MINKKVLLLSLAVVFFIVGVHQSFYFGIQASYWAFMLAGFSFLGMQYLKKKEEEAEKNGEASNNEKKRASTKKKRKKRK